jgi:anaerobic magnesium-protoporphyrin IX monomethyl ester cyclase
MDDIILISTSGLELGIRSISSYLRSNGCSTKCLFLNQPETKEYKRSTLDALLDVCNSGHIVGISGIQATQYKTKQIITALHGQGKVIVIGGYDATLCPERYIEADYICIGDGEKSMLELVKRLESSDAPKRGILPLKPLINLSELSSEDYDNRNKFYLLENGDIVPLESQLEYKNPRGNTKNSIFYMASRGCPYSCSFCEEPNFIKLSDSKPVRLKQVDKVISELKDIKGMYPQTEKIFFMDPEFFSKPPSWINTFSRYYKECIDLPFWVFGHPSSIKEDKLSKLVEAGLKELQLGIQSGSERTRIEDYNRSTSDKKIKDVIRLCHKYDVYPWIDIIFNNPYETKDDLLKTINILKDLQKPFQLGSFGLEFLPGTTLSARAETDNLLLDANEHNFHNRKAHKNKNTYLNSLIRVMAGTCTDSYLGIIPVSALSTLIQPKIINFMEGNPEFSYYLDNIIKSQSELAFR